MKIPIEHVDQPVNLQVTGSTVEARFYYDPKRPYAHGRWVIVLKGKHVSQMEYRQSERQVHQVLGLPGGNADPHYAPERHA